MVEGIGTGVIPAQQSNNKPKTNTGKTVLGLAGLALGTNEAIGYIDKCSHSNLLSDASYQYRSAWSGCHGLDSVRDMMLKNKSSAKNFIYNAMKKTRNINLAKAGLALVGFTAAGLAVGALVDGVVNAVKNKKATKAANSESV